MSKIPESFKDYWLHKETTGEWLSKNEEMKHLRTWFTGACWQNSREVDSLRSLVSSLRCRLSWVKDGLHRLGNEDGEAEQKQIDHLSSGIAFELETSDKELNKL